MNIGKETSNTHQAFWVIIGSLSSFSLAIVSSAILSRYFPKEEYGTYKQIIYIYSTLLIIFTAGLPEVFAYFLPRYGIEEGRAIVWKITKTLFLSGALFSLFLFLSSGVIAEFLNNPELELGIKVFSPIPFLLLPTLGIEGIFSTYKKTIFIGIYNTLTRFITLLFIVLPVIIFKGSYLTAIYGWIVVSFISLLIAFYFKGIPFGGVKPMKASLTYKSIFQYSLPLVTASLWGIGLRSADQFYISRYFGSKVFAEFSNGFMQLPLVSMVTSATSLVLMPVFSKMVHDKTALNDLLSLWKNALFKSALIIYPIVIFAIFFANDIIVIIFSKAYEHSTIYFQINMVLNFFNIIVFAPLILSLGKTRLYSRIHMFFALAVWALEYLAILIFHSPIAVAFVSVFMGILIGIVFMFYISISLKVNIAQLFPFKLIMKIVLHNIFIILLLKYSFDSLKIQSTILELSLASIVYAVLILGTSKPIRLNYFEPIKPILLKNELFVSLNKKIRNTIIGKIY